MADDAPDTLPDELPRDPRRSPVNLASPEVTTVFRSHGLAS